jgi:hypothetical protein
MANPWDMRHWESSRQSAFPDRLNRLPASRPRSTRTSINQPGHAADQQYARDAEHDKGDEGEGAAGQREAYHIWGTDHWALAIPRGEPSSVTDPIVIAAGPRQESHPMVSQV